MGLSSDQNSNSFGKGSLKLLIQLVNTDLVNKVVDGSIIWLASEHNADIEGNEHIVVCWSSSNWELVSNILLSYQELDLGPWKAKDDATLSLNVIKLTVLGDNGVGSLWPIITNKEFGKIHEVR
jgi:hypothetical protein